MKIRRENKGFSLVELIITIAIFSVVGVTLGAFLLSSSRAYSINANELDIQEEAQLVANQLQEMILDTPIAISYKYSGVDDAGNLIDTFDVPVDMADVDQTNLYIYGVDYYYHIYWNKEEQKLYFVDYQKGPTGFAPNDMDATGVVLGEYISDFFVDMSKVNSDRIVSFSIVFKKPGSERDYLVSKTVALRNNISANRETTEVYNALGITVAPAADSMSLSPTVDYLWPGESRPFTVTLNCSQGGVPNQGVNWTIKSKDTSYTTLDGGTFMTSSNTLQVSANEDSSWIEAKASAMGYDYTNNTDLPLVQIANIYVKQIRKLEVVSTTMDTGVVGAGGRYTVVVAMQGENIDGMALDGENGIDAYAIEGAGYITSLVVEPHGELQAKVTFDLAANTPKGAKIQLGFKPKRMEFYDVVTTTDVYTVNGNKEMLMLESGSGTDWLRLGTSIANVKFVDEDVKDTYCHSNGGLKTGFYMKYVYEVYDSNSVKVATAYRTSGSGNGNDYTQYFEASSSGVFRSVVKMTEKMFLTSGEIKVKAYLMSKTDGESVEVGSSNVCTFVVPEVTVGYKRNIEDTAVSSMISYITNDRNSTPIYITFTSGYVAGSTPSLNYVLAKISPEASYGEISYVDSSNGKVTVTGRENSWWYNYYNKGNTINFTYAELPNGVEIKLVSANVKNNNWRNPDRYYVPTNKDEWTLVNSYLDSSNKLHSFYKYYINDTNYMYIYYVGNTFNSATLYKLENQSWKDDGKYKIDVGNNNWSKVG